jgi:hypothetical protein
MGVSARHNSLHDDAGCRRMGVGCIYSDHAVHLAILTQRRSGADGCRVDLTGLSRMPDALAPGLPGWGRRSESLRLKSRSIVPGMDAGAPAATSRGRAVGQPPQAGEARTPDREDAQVSTVI